MIMSEIYSCIQGEGQLVGTPSILVRTSTCNLRCKWGENFCDTPFSSWKPETTLRLTPTQILEEVTKLNPQGKIKHIILSGGEPTIQPEITELLYKLGGYYHTTIETNGTKVLPDNIGVPLTAPVFADNILFSISPKLASSVPVGTPFEKMHQRERIQPDILKLLTSQWAFYLKFVITSVDDLKEVRLLQDSLKISSERIYLMPEGITPEQVRSKALWVAELCKQEGYRYSPRLHLDIWGPKRGT